MCVDDEVLWSIGEVARKTGLSVKLIRHWSELGLVPPAGRTAAGYRVFAPESLARLELARTLRDLGLGLRAIRDVLDREHTLAEVAAAHADALEEQIRTLRSQQAVLRSVTRRGTTAEGLAFMNRTARLTAVERRTIIHEFVAEALGDLDVPTYRRGLLAATPELPDHPTDEQVDAWIELSELVTDTGLRSAMRRMAQYAAEHAPGEHDDEALRAARQVTDYWAERVHEAMREGIAPDSPAADAVVAAIVAVWLPTQTQIRTCDEVYADGGTGAAPSAGTARSRLRCARRALLAAAVPHQRRSRAAEFGSGRQLADDCAAYPSRAGSCAARNSARCTTPGPTPGNRRACWTPASVFWQHGGRPRLRRGPGHVRPADAMRPMGRSRAARPPGVGEPVVVRHGQRLPARRLRRRPPRRGPRRGLPRRRAQRRVTAFRRPGMLEERYGPAPGRRLVEQLVIEMLVHGWDLATAIGHPRDLVPDLAEAALPVVQRDLRQPAPYRRRLLRPAPAGSLRRDRTRPSGGLPRPIGHLSPATSGILLGISCAGVRRGHASVLAVPKWPGGGCRQRPHCRGHVSFLPAAAQVSSLTTGRWSRRPPAPGPPAWAPGPGSIEQREPAGGAR